MHEKWSRAFMERGQSPSFHVNENSSDDCGINNWMAEITTKGVAWNVWVVQKQHSEWHTDWHTEGHSEWHTEISK